MKSLTDKVVHTATLFRGGLPLESKIKLAKKFLLWTVNTIPGPPVDTGRLKRSGTAYVGDTKVYNLGGPSGHAIVGQSKDIITITYSTPKKVKDKATEFYHFRGSRWFDYASYQHANHATNKLWAYVLLTKRSVKAAVVEEMKRNLRKVW